MPFAQLVIGPPGSGKSTYCDGMHQFMSAIGRKCSVVNLDPANDQTPYPCALDVRDLVTLEEIMEDDELGPNGAVLYALEELEHNWDWLERGLKALGGLCSVRLPRAGRAIYTSFIVTKYLLPDTEAWVQSLLPPVKFTSQLAFFIADHPVSKKLVALHLTDSYTLTLPSLYISTLLLSLRTMLQMDLPHLNVLTKIDKLSSYGPLPFNLDYYTEVQDLSYLLPAMEQESPMMAKNKFEGLNRAIIELVDDFGLVSFETLAVEDKKSMMTLLHAIDRAGGYAFGSAEGANDTVWQVAVREGMSTMTVQDVQERWLDRKDEFDEMERQALVEEGKAREAPSLIDDAGDDEDDDDEIEELERHLPDSGVKVVRRS